MEFRAEIKGKLLDNTQRRLFINFEIKIGEKIIYKYYSSDKGSENIREILEKRNQEQNEKITYYTELLIESLPLILNKKEEVSKLESLNNRELEEYIINKNKDEKLLIIRKDGEINMSDITTEKILYLAYERENNILSSIQTIMETYSIIPDELISSEFKTYMENNFTESRSPKFFKDNKFERDGDLKIFLIIDFMNKLYENTINNSLIDKFVSSKNYTEEEINGIKSSVKKINDKKESILKDYAKNQVAYKQYVDKYFKN
ncbi:hypothetical protein [Methanobrevibacter sp. DSM 116169]|uniref:hypothetical protein n=1 Tax=Methanobrevibacter sp. DSM 116169 TaxID=3242727 RepID=UPI0038FC2132